MQMKGVTELPIHQAVSLTRAADLHPLLPPPTPGKAALWGRHRVLTFPPGPGNGETAQRPWIGGGSGTPFAVQSSCMTNRAWVARRGMGGDAHARSRFSKWKLPQAWEGLKSAVVAGVGPKVLNRSLRFSEGVATVAWGSGSRERCVWLDCEHPNFGLGLEVTRCSSGCPATRGRRS